MTATFGWTIASAYTHDKDNDTAYKSGLAVSLIRPFLTAETLDESVWVSAGPSISRDDANAGLGQLLSPWQWGLKQRDEVNLEVPWVYEPQAWQLYLDDGTGNYEKKEAPLATHAMTEELNPQDAQALVRSIEREIDVATRPSSNRYFSALPDDADGTSGRPVSLVHKLAPLAHLVAPVSNGALRLTHYIPLPEDLPADSKVLAMPVFRLYRVNGHDNNVVLFQPTEEVSLVGDGLYRVGYKATDADQNPVTHSVAIDNVPTSCEIAFVAEAVACSQPSATTMTEDDWLKKTKWLRREEMAIQLAPSLVHPLSLALRVVRRLRDELRHLTSGAEGSEDAVKSRIAEIEGLLKNVQQNTTWIYGLLQTLGTGWIYDSSDRRWMENQRPLWDHVFESHQNDENLNALLRGAAGEPGAWKAKLKVDGMPVWPASAWSDNDISSLMQSLKTHALSLPSSQQNFWSQLIEYHNDTHPRDPEREEGALESDLDRWESLAHQAASRDSAAAISQTWLAFLARYRTDTANPEILQSLVDSLERINSEEMFHRQLLVALDGFVHQDLVPQGEDFVTQVRALYKDQHTKPQPITDWLKRALTGFGLHEDEHATDEIKKAVKALTEAVDRETTPKAMPRDDGLPLRLDIETDEGALDELDNEIRGYAIGLRGRITSSGKMSGADWWQKKQWMTNTHVAYKTEEIGSDQKPIKRLLRKADNLPVWASSSVGSVQMAGRRLADIFYDQDPIAAVESKAIAEINGYRHAGAERAEADYDSTDALDYNWYSTIESESSREQPVLPLVYGAWYDGITVAIENSGVVQSEAARHKDYPGEIVQFDEIETGTWKGAIRYLSLEPPASPAFKYDGGDPTDRFKVSEDTQASEFIATKAVLTPRDVRPIAFMAPTKREEVYREQAPGAHSLALDPPLASESFICRWLNGDIAAIEMERRDLISGGFSNELQAQITESEIEELQNYVRKEYRKYALTNDTANSLTKGPNSSELDDLPFRYHPAVTALGIRARWYRNGMEIGDRQTLALPLGELVAYDKIEDEQGQEVKVVRPVKMEALRWHAEVMPTTTEHSANVMEEPADGGTRRVKVYVEPGCFVRLDVCSLIDEKWIRTDENIDRVNDRFHEKLREVRSRSAGMDIIEDAGNTYIAFSATSQWIESGPEWDANPTLKDELLTIIGPSPSANQSRRLELRAPELKAQWIKGVRVERHQWHWSGHPVDFPTMGSDSLKESILGFATAGSFREMQEITLATEFIDADAEKGTDSDWRIQSGQTLNRISVPNNGSSSYDAFTVRPISRFRAWLKTGTKGPLDIENTVLATGKLRPVPPPRKRLTPPIPRWTSPLTESYETQEWAPEILPHRGRNGSLLIFDEAFMRTDNLSHNSGVGEVIEVDVVDTRHYPIDDATRNGHKEAGPNPIFHRAPTAPRPPKTRTIHAHEVAVDTSAPFGLTHDLGSNPKIAQTAIVVFPNKALGKWWLAKVRTRRMLLPETLTDYVDTRKLEGPYELNMRLVGEEWVPATSPSR